MTALAHGLLCLTGRPVATPGTWTCDLLAIASGTALLAGFLTPVAGLVMGLGSTGTALGWTGASGLGLLGPGLATLFLAIMAIAIVCLGPGARSLDARLFGRREIVITPARRARDT